jgi:hypothetical protein
VTPRTPYNTLSHEFDGFLFAPIGAERNGMSLSVISALTRLNIDPWGEAARLAELSKEKAIDALAPIIARVPAGEWTAVDVPAIARRLVDALPRHEVIAPSVARVPISGEARSRAIYLAFLVILAVFYFGLVARPQPPAVADATPSAQAAPSAPSDAPH